MIDLFIRVFDAIIDLIRNKSNNEEDFIEKVIDPFFIEVQFCVEDYFIIFKKLEDEINNNKEIDQQIVNLLIMMREQHRIKRMKILEIAEVMRKEINKKEILKLTNNVVIFFTNVGLSTDNSNATAINTYLDFIIDSQRSNIKLSIEVLANLDEKVKKTIKDMESYWLDIVRSYTELRLKYLSISKLKYVV